MSRKSSRWIGVDVGSSSIKLIEIEHAATGLRLIRQLTIELSDPSSAAGGDAPAAATSQSPGALSSSAVVQNLRAAFSAWGAAEVHLVVSGPEVIVRRVALPMMSKEELSEAVKWQVKDELPFPVSEAVVAYEVAGEIQEQDVKQLNVIVAAAPSAFLQDRLHLVEQAGGRVASIVPAALALCASFDWLAPDHRQHPSALIEVGAEQTRVVILKEGHPQLVRDIGLGSAHLTRALIGVTVSERGEVVLDAARAEQIKRAHGIVTESADGAADGELSFGRLAALMRPVLENLLTELGRLFDFYKVHVDGGGVTRIFLCGGGARLPHLPEFLHEGLGLDVEPFEPLRVLQPSRSDDEGQPREELQDGSRFTGALGAALLHGQRMTLMPPTLITMRRETKMRLLFGAAATALGLALVVGYALLRLALWQGEQRVHTAQHEWNMVQPSYQQYLAMNRERQQAQDTLEAFQAFTARQLLWEGMLKEISHVLPPNIQLTDVLASMPNDHADDPASMTVHLKGLVEGADGGATGSLTTLLKTLEDSLFFKNVHLAGTQVQTGAGKATVFDIICHME